jgi:type I restriction enzyme M protein
VKPHLPKVCINKSKTKVGYEINFTKYFYEFESLRPLADIKAEIRSLEEKPVAAGKAVLES